MKKFNVHLVSDSTGETLNNICRAVYSQFSDIEPEEHIWSLTRTRSQMEKVIAGVREHPGLVLYTLVDKDIADMLKRTAKELNIPCIAVLEKITETLSIYIGEKITPQIGRQHELDEDYFSRVEAIHYTLAHDDGQATHDLNEADIVLVGVSRTSKTPTCVYLANRGYKVANIPYVSENLLPETLFSLTKPLVVGLTINPERLVHIRKSRMMSIKEQHETGYTNLENIDDEVVQAKKLFMKNRWPVIDVTKKSVEETAATIIQFYQNRREK